MSVWQTILDQLTQYDGTKGTAYGRLVAMIGAKDFVTFGNAVSFRFKMCKKFNHVKIKLMPDDTYTVTLCKVWGAKILNETVYSGIYCDQLKDLFESNTGLYLCL